LTKTEKQQEIFNAALKLFARYGFRKTTGEREALHPACMRMGWHLFYGDCAGKIFNFRLALN
jgi:hypothetical protein